MPDENSSSLYRAVWRLHFCAGIIVAPFTIFLAFTGAIYLWKPQFENARYRDRLFVPPQATTALSHDAQFAAARATHPDAMLLAFMPAFYPDRASETLLRPSTGGKVSVFVDPYSGRVLGERRESERFMSTIQTLHSSLLAGRAGETLVELAASWALVLFLTGLYLWWPRPVFSVWGFFLPRLRAKSRVFWRDVHAVPAVWFSAATIFMLTTGLLWTSAAGKWYRTISAAAGQATPRESSASAHRSELTGWSPPLQAGVAERIDALASDPGAHADHARHDMGGDTVAAASGVVALPARISIDRVIALASEHRVPTPYSIAFPVGERGVFSAISDRNQAFTRTYLRLDQYSGKVLADVRYPQFGLLAKFGLWSIIAHEGQLFGFANQILGTLAAAGVFLLSASGLVMWWKRRPAGILGAPTTDARLPRPVVFGTLALACALPLLAASLAVLIVGDWMLARMRTAKA